MTVSLIKPIELAFIGAYKTDIMLHLAAVLANLSYRVLVIDKSSKQYCRNYLEGVNQTEYDQIYQLISKANIDFAFENTESINLMDYDYVLIDYGFSLNQLEAFVKAKWTFVISDFKKHHVKQLRNQLKFIKDHLQLPEALIKIYKDYIPSKIDSTYLDHQYQLEGLPSLVANYELMQDHHHDKCDLLNTYNQSFSFKLTGQAYEHLVEDVVEEVTGKKKSEVKKSIGKVRRGGIR